MTRHVSIADEFTERFDRIRPGYISYNEVENALFSEESNFRDAFGPWPNMNRDDEYDYILNKVADRFGIDPDEL